MAKNHKEVDHRQIDSLDVTRKAIEKKYGDVLSMMGDEPLVIDSVSTGSLGLDTAIGNGGFAKGRVYEVFGPPSGGKTTLTMSLIAQAQKRGMRCAFVDAERAADPKLFKAMGVDTDSLYLIRAFSGEANLDILEQLIATGEIDVGVVDSVSSLIPKSEAAAGMEDQFMGLLARLMSKAMRKFVPLAGETNTLVIFINQVRNKIGAYGDPETTTGGVALDFSATGRIRVHGGASKASRIESLDGEIIGHHTEFKVVKNKLAKPARKATVPLIYGEGYDTYWECLKLATDLGVIDKAGSWYSYGDVKIGQGEVNTLAYFKLPENSDVYNEIRYKVMESLGLIPLYEENGGIPT